MIKKTFFILFLFIFMSLPQITNAQTITSIEYNASNDTYYLYWDLSNVDYYIFKNNTTGSQAVYDATGRYEGKQWINPSDFRCNASFTVTFYDSSGTVLNVYNGQTTQIKNEPESCKADNSNGNSDGCDCVFNSPHWSVYMGKIDEIINAIPQPPNWQQVANTFRDTIVPKFINDLGNMLGSAPTPPSAQKKPAIPSYNLDKPTGQESSNLGNSTFTGDDLKNDAPKIDVREDESGGFNILDPIGQLPSQEEFKENIPDEPDNYAPNVPDVEAEAPEPPEESIPFPNDPEEESETAPIPDEEKNTAPTPNEPENNAPMPEEEKNTAPMPDDSEGNAPIPNEDDNRLPFPDDSDGGYPIPSDDNSKPPMPQTDNEKAPIPKK